MTLNLQKCRFGIQSVEYLGFVVGEGVISPGKRKIKAVGEFSKPTNVHEVRRFIGLVSFFRRFIPQFALIAAPLTDLLKESKSFKFFFAKTVHAAHTYSLILSFI